MQWKSVPKSVSILIYCICTGRCFTYLIKVLFSLSENLTVGHTCEYDLQCTGTEFASVCDNGWCECHSGYIRNCSNCYPGKVLFW